MALSHVMLLSSFVILCHQFLTMETWINKLSNFGWIPAIQLFVIMILIRLYRKPPDIVYEVNGLYLAITGRQSMLLKWLIRIIIFLLSVYSWTHVPDWVSDQPSFPHEANQLSQIMNEQISYCNRDFHCNMARRKDKVKPRDMGTWDSDSKPIVIDSATTRTLTPHLEDLHEVEEFNSSVEGIGSGAITHKGRIKWPVESDNGKTVFIEDDDAYYCPDAPYRLLCPHSWKKCQDDRRYQNGETEGDQANLLMAEENTGYYLTWDRGRITVAAPLDSSTNLPMIYMVAGYTTFSAFAGAFKCFPTVIPDDDSISDDVEYRECNSFDHTLPDDVVLPTQPTDVDFATDDHTEPPIRVDDPVTQRDVAQFLS